MPDIWVRLAAPFPDEAQIWLVTELSLDENRARLRSQISFEAICSRLDSEVGIDGWSNTYVVVGTGVLGCALTVGRITKSAMAEALDGKSTGKLGQLALVRAAELFGMKPNRGTEYTWVDYEETKVPSLQEPLISPITLENSRVNVSSEPLDTSERNAEPQKSKGQIATDRLVDRLRDAGRSEETARLLVEYGGYGNDGEAARELYGKLRALLLK